MNTTRIGALLVALLLVGGPAFALEALSLYDNFNNLTYINYTKWTGSSFDALDTMKYIVFPVAGDGELRLQARGFGFRTSAAATEARNVNNRLRFRRADPNVVRAIKATVKVNSASATGCSTAGSEPTQARFKLTGWFFNDGTGEPGRGTGDVQARVEIRRLSNSTVAGQLNVRAAVFRCLESECVLAQTLFNQTLGTILVGNAATLLLQWDPATNRFLFQLNALPVVNYVYGLPDTAPPQNFFDKKLIEIGHYIGNCVPDQTQAFMSVNVDDVYVNTAATLATTAPKTLAGATPVTEGFPESEAYIPEPDDLQWVTESEPFLPEPDE